jgi:NADPH-dependent ferric siderophore reductase
MLTLPSVSERVRDDRPAYRPFRVEVRAIEQLSPSFQRVTFAGDELADFGTAGLDQRVKLVLPLEGDDAAAGYDRLGLCTPEVAADGSWYERWRAVPTEHRNPLRTYTVRGIRPERRELDIDFAVHGDGGPASRWVSSAREGDELVVVGPDDRSAGWRIGLDWHPGPCRELLLVGDETAVPAVCAILESLSPEVHATAFLEVPHAADSLDVACAAHHEVTWLPREGGARGAELLGRVREWALAHRDVIVGRTDSGAEAPRNPESDLDGIIWDSPDAPSGDGFYSWIAGETHSVVTLRRFFVSELGVSRKRVAFMGYWRRGRAEAD